MMHSNFSRSVIKSFLQPILIFSLSLYEMFLEELVEGGFCCKSSINLRTVLVQTAVLKRDMEELFFRCFSFRNRPIRPIKKLKLSDFILQFDHLICTFPSQIKFTNLFLFFVLAKSNLHF